MQTATILLNRAVMNAPIMSDGALKALLWDRQMVPGASTTEFELAKRVDAYGRGCICISYYTLYYTFARIAVHYPHARHNAQPPTSWRR